MNKETFKKILVIVVVTVLGVGVITLIGIGIYRLPINSGLKIAVILVGLLIAALTVKDGGKKK